MPRSAHTSFLDQAAAAAFVALTLHKRLICVQESALPRLKRVLTLLHSIAQGMRAANLADTAGCTAACRAVAAFVGTSFGQSTAAAHSAPSGVENDRPGGAPAEGEEQPDEDEEVCFPCSRLPWDTAVPEVRMACVIRFRIAMSDSAAQVIVFNPSASAATAAGAAAAPPPSPQAPARPVSWLDAARREAEGVLASPAEEAATAMIVSPQPNRNERAAAASPQPEGGMEAGNALASGSAAGLPAASAALGEMEAGPASSHLAAVSVSQPGTRAPSEPGELPPASRAGVGDEDPGAFGGNASQDPGPVLPPVAASTHGWDPLSGRLLTASAPAPVHSAGLLSHLCSPAHVVWLAALVLLGVNLIFLNRPFHGCQQVDCAW